MDQIEIIYSSKKKKIQHHGLSNSPRSVKRYGQRGRRKYGSIDFDMEGEDDDFDNEDEDEEEEIRRI